MNTALIRQASLASVFLVFGHGPALSQAALPDAVEDLASRDGIAAAASKLAGEGKDRLLLTNMLDEKIKGSDGETIGTVKDFAVIPGGRVIAAIVETDDGMRIAIPYGAVKVAVSADALGLEVPVNSSDIQSLSELESLAESLGSD